MRNSSKNVIRAAAAAVVATLLPTTTRAATVTWTGAVADPSSANYVATAQGTARGFTTGQNLYLWNTSVANWSGAATYTAGDNVIFTDNFAGGTDIRLPSGNMNPASITFSHIAGSTPVTYRFINSSGTLGSADFFTDNTNSANLGNNTPFGASASTTLTLDTGFLGTVKLGHRSNGAVTAGNTIIKGGVLEINDGGALPHNANQNQPPVTLDGGELRINVNTNTNTNPASTQLGGTLTVLSDSSISNGAINNSRIWNGPVSMANGITLTLKSINGFRLDLSNMNFTNTAGTIRLEDVGANTTVAALQANNNRGANAIWDLGTGNSELLATTGNNTYNLGALTGGANTKLSGSTTASSTTTYVIGERNENSTYAGTIRDNTTQVTGLGAVTKTGTATLTLTGANTYTGPTTVSNGTLLVSGAAGSISGSAPTINQAATLSIDNTTNNNNRLSDSAALTLNQGNLVFQGNLSSPTAELAGALTPAGGSNVVQTTATGAGGPASLTFASLARTGGVVDFRPAAGVNVALTSSSPTNGILGGFATVNQNDWAAVSGGNVVAYSAYTTDTAPAGWVAADNVNLTTGGTSTVAASKTINSLRTAGTGTTVSISAGQTLNIGTGGILATGTGGASISGAGTLTAGSAAAEMIVTVPTAANTLNISAPIADNGGGAVTLVKAGAGKLVLSGSGSTFTGGTQLLAGTLQVGSANYFPAGSNLTINYGTAFDIGGFNQSFGTVALIDGSLLNSGGAASVTATTYDVRNGTVSAALGGSGALAKTTGGTVTLTGANNYSGGTTVTGGTLAAGAANTLPAGQAVSVSSGATLNVGAFNQSIGTLTIGNLTTSSGNINGTSGVITASSIDAQNGTVNAILGGTTGLTKSGINTTVTLNGLNTYTGPTAVVSSGNSGTLAVNTLANGGSPSSVGASSSASTNLVLGGGTTLLYTGTGSSTDRLFNLGGNVSINSNGTGPVNFTGTGSIGGASGGTLTLTGGNTGANTFSPLLDSSNINGLTKGGNGTWVVTNSNTYVGVTSVGGAGVLSIPAIANGGVASPIGASSNAASSLVVNGATLRYTGAGNSSDRLFSIGTGGATFDGSGTGAVTLGSAGGANVTSGTGARTLTLTGSNTGNNTMGGVLANGAAGTDTLAINKTGTGKWVLGAANTYTAGTTVTAGTLSAGHGDAFAGGALTVANGATGAIEPGTTKAVTLTTLNTNTSGKFDVTNNSMVIKSQTDAQVRTQLTAGYNGGAWNGATGIVSSSVNSSTSVGYASNTSLGLTEFKGVSGLTGTDVIVKYTYAGDANLDGKVDIGDLGLLAGAWQQLTGKVWFDGDFTYDGAVNIGDLGLLAGNWQKGTVGNPNPPLMDFNTALAQFSAFEGVVVPEPASLSLLALGGLAALGRRRRRSA